MFDYKTFFVIIMRFLLQQKINLTKEKKKQENGKKHLNVKKRMISQLSLDSVIKKSSNKFLSHN